jgi:hypothetical protein|tara:strand:+ start:12709 stop:14310 length:1602 start_codon:yes stop_codon:yes gene_type:complete
MVSNEIYTGAGASATLIPEMEFDIGQGFEQLNDKLSINSENLKEVEWNLSGGVADKLLIVNILKGCMAKVTVYATNTLVVRIPEQVLMIKSNTVDSITFNVALATETPDTKSDKVKVVLQAFGAPLFRPSSAADKPYLLSDQWLGLVNSIMPPTLDVENRQYNLAMGASRDFGFQFKGKETIGNGSLDVSVNSGLWLYYTLGKMSIAGTTTASSHLGAPVENAIYLNTTAPKNTKFRRVIEGTGGEKTFLPPLHGEPTTECKLVNSTIVNGVPIIANNFTYDFTATNGAILPSFALEITNEKDAQTLTDGVDAKPRENIWSRIYTGCQVNSLTFSFEEGMELKSTVDFMSRRIFDAPTGYVPKAGKTDVTKLLNYNTDQDANKPFMFSDGEIRIFGQEYARVKSGTLTITNTLTPHSFIGNYDRSITSAHTAGQRIYDLSLTLLITDSEIWDKLREQNEAENQVDGSLISLIFTKNDEDGADAEQITLTLDDYIVTNVDIPFPEDRGPIEATMTVAPRTMKTAQYIGKWAIMG